ncbi:MAG TPA: hypothetical protein VMZ53_20500 [Kofleriaceae bacterium]|nr:hypothetical protein [Kofleriaceae bacterium]
MDGNADKIGQIVGIVITGLIGFGVYWSLRGGKLKLAPGETRIAYIYANWPGHRFGGLIVAGSPSDGKLVLTTQRLIFTNPTEGKVALAVTVNEIQSVAKGSKGPLMTLELGYKTPKGKLKSASFTQVLSNPTIAIDPKRELPIGMFIDKITAWREGRAA